MDILKHYFTKDKFDLKYEHIYDLVRFDISLPLQTEINLFDRSKVNIINGWCFIKTSNNTLSLEINLNNRLMYVTFKISTDSNGIIYYESNSTYSTLIDLFCYIKSIGGNMCQFLEPQKVEKGFEVKELLKKINRREILTFKEKVNLNNINLKETVLFHDIDRASAESLLSSKSEGWLLRTSSQVGKIALHSKTTTGTNNYLFIQKGDKINEFLVKEKKERSFSTDESIYDFFVFLRDRLSINLENILMNTHMSTHKNTHLGTDYLIFDFDLTLTTEHYFNIRASVENKTETWHEHSNLEYNRRLLNLNSEKKTITALGKAELINMFFGNETRFEKLVNLLKMLKPKYKLVISSKNYNDWIVDLLEKVGIRYLFDEIYGREKAKVHLLEETLTNKSTRKVIYIDDKDDQHLLLINKHKVIESLTSISYINKFEAPTLKNYYFSKLFSTRTSSGLSESQIDELQKLNLDF